MSIIDEKINNGYDKKIVEAVSLYMRVPKEVIEVENDLNDPEYTLVFLKNVDTNAPRMRLGIHELGRHEGARIEVTGEGKQRQVRIQIEDANIEAITEFMLSRQKK